ncbi:MAG TPA: single-stranded DNA-binding protein [Candidatus Omnitrophota bacterium]|nr:single-stranded DNA-binding protein [Candidatus Omnitrophota bacterium]
MAASLNKVFLMGNLTRDPELRYLPSGQPVTSFSIAMNRVYNSQTGEKKEEVSYVRVVVWARLAEICNEYLKKGSPVFVEGRLQSRSWEAQDGTKRSSIEVVAQNVQFLPRGGQGRGAEGSAPAMDGGDEAMFDDVDAFPGSGSTSSSGAKGARGASSIPADELKPDEDVPF